MQIDVAQVQQVMTEEIEPVFEMLRRKLKSAQAWLRLPQSEFALRRETEIRIEERQKERERISRDLHDTLLQSFQHLRKLGHLTDNTECRVHLDLESCQGMSLSHIVQIEKRSKSR